MSMWASCRRRRRHAGRAHAAHRSAQAGPRTGRVGLSRPASGVLALGVLQPEEGALAAVGPLLLVDEVEPPLVEGPEPFVPADLAQLRRVLAAVEAQDAEPVAVLGALDGRGPAATLLRPLADDLVAR